MRLNKCPDSDIDISRSTEATMLLPQARLLPSLQSCVVRYCH